MSNHLVKIESEKEYNEGIKLYSDAGKVFIGVAIVFFVLIIFISFMPQDYEKYNISLYFGLMFAISGILFFGGIVLLLLCKKSKRFQDWANKDVEKATEKLGYKLFMKDKRLYEKKQKKKIDKMSKRNK